MVNCPTVHCALALLIAAAVAGCGESELESPSATCEREPRAFDESQIEGEPVCFGDTVILRLDPAGAGMIKSIDVQVPRAGRARFCLELREVQEHRLELTDENGTLLSRIDQADGCAEVDLGAGLHTLHAINALAPDPNRLGQYLFVRPVGDSTIMLRDAPNGAPQHERVYDHSVRPQSRTSTGWSEGFNEPLAHTRSGDRFSQVRGQEARSAVSKGSGAASAGTPELLGTYKVSTDCPGCDLRGANLSGIVFHCTDKTTGQCHPDDPANSQCMIFDAKGNFTFFVTNDLSGALFGGASFLGSNFSCVNFANAQFWDDTYGAAKFGNGPSCCDGIHKNTLMQACQLRGASFRNVDLSSTWLTCYPNSGSTAYYLPSFLAGADLRGANMSGIDYSIASCPWIVDPNDPYGKTRLDLSDALVDANTNLTNTNLGGANLTGWNWHATEWSTASFQRSILADGDMSGIDFTASKYAGKFFIADKNVDRFAHADFTGVNFTGAKLAALDLELADMPFATFTSANLHGAKITGADFFRANFTGADLGAVTATEASPATFDGATMTHAFLQMASLPGSFFRGAVLAPANLGGAMLGGAYFEVDPLCIDAQKRCLVAQPRCICAAASLAGSFMHNTNLSMAHMTDTVLNSVSWYNDTSTATTATGSGAFLNGASFDFADLPGLDLSDAYLQGATLTNTQLIGANLSGAQLGPGGTRTNLSMANLRGANLTNADLTSAILQNAGVDAAAEAEVYIEVLKDPAHYTQPEEYQFFAVNRPATNLGAGDTVATTDFATCPNSSAGPCGPITDPAWIAPTPPKEPTDCVVTACDSEGNVTAIKCQSGRHPTGGLVAGEGAGMPQCPTPTPTAKP